MTVKHSFKFFIIALLLILSVPLSAQDDIDCADDSHLIDHALGTSCVPAGVERVVTLEWSYTEAVLALGVQPVGMADIEGYHGWVDIPVEIDESVVDVGTRQEPNLEQIIELDPDLIIAPAFRVVESYDQLNAIAPTLAFDAYPTDTTHYDGMINTFNTIATLLDREAEAEAVLADLQATYDATAKAIAESDITMDNFILAQSYISGDAPVFRLFTDNAMAVEILRQLGLENAWTDAPQQYGFTTVDFEGFSEIEDTLFFYIAQDEANEQIVNAPVWSALPFVQNDHQYWLGGDVWLFGGPLSAMTLVETISDSLGLDVEDTDTSDDTASTCDEGYRLYSNDLLWDGTTDGVCIPDSAERVVIANHPTYLLDNVLALGVEPVGIAVYLDRFAVSPYLADQVEGIEHVGSFREPNLEVILGLEPDLILSTTFREDYYDQLSAIAPTVLLEWDQVSWKDFLLATGDAVNRLSEAETLLSEYEERVTTIRSVLAESESLPEVSVVRVRPDNLRYYVTSSFSGQVLQDVGLPRPEAQSLDEEDTLYQVVSMEEIDLIDGDMMFVWGATDGTDEAVTELEASPLWQQLNAVQNEQVYYVDEAYWFAPGIIGTHLLLDDILTYIAEVDPAEVAPNPFTSEDTASVTCDEGFRLIEHAEGADCIPNELERIVVLDEGTMTDLLALGIQPIAVMDWGNRDYAQYLNLDPSTIESVGTPEGPNFEAILELEPDIILGYANNIQWFGDNALENLQAIAPTVLSPAVNPDWQSHLLFLGEVVGAEDRAQSLLDSFNTRLGEFATAWEASGDDSTIAIIRSRADSFNIYANGYFISDTVKAAGLQMPASFAELPERIAISVEEIDMLDSDYLFVMARNADEAEAFMDASEGPLWQFLPAVENDQVYQVNWSVWVAGWNVVGAHLVVDDLFHYLLDTEPPTPNPLSDVISDDFSPTFDVERFADTTEQS